MNQLQLSSETLKGLATLATQRNLSINDFFEKIIQGKLAVIDAEELEDLMDVKDAIAAESDPENQECFDWEDIKQELAL